MFIIQQIEHLLDEGHIKKAQRLFELYFAVYPQQAKQCIHGFQQDGYWQLPPVPKSLEEVEVQVRVLWKENYLLKAIEFYRLNTGCTLKESRDKVQVLCSDIDLGDEE